MLLSAAVKLPNQFQYNYNSSFISIFLINKITYVALCRFKLPVTIIDETGSIEPITFSYVAKELVEQSPLLTSQNMKIDAYDHVVSLDKAIRKIKLFTIGVSATSTSALPIKYVVKKFFDIDHSLFWFNYKMYMSFYSSLLIHINS
jgi:hypothetical protein